MPLSALRARPCYHERAILHRSIVPPEPPPSPWQEGDWLFILKVMILSALISVGIKAFGPLLALPATAAVALALILSPPLLLGLILVWRERRQLR